MQGKKRNKRKIIFWFIVSSILFSPAFMYLTWYFSSFKELRCIIVDKTVYNEKREEHSSFNWILNYEKYCKQGNQLYNKDTDYFGFYPHKDEKFSIRDFENMNVFSIDSIVENNDVFYYNDAYGVYSNQWYHHVSLSERSKKIYGGATHVEALLLKKAHQKNKLILTEFNILASPTNEQVRKDLEQEFKFSWTGWVGRYFNNLDTTINKELPKWLKKNYLNQHNHAWPFKKSGIVLINENDQIEILEMDRHLKHKHLMISTKDVYQTEYDIPEKLKFNFWFDIIENVQDNQIISTYELATNRSGDSILKKIGIPNRFPAAICSPTKRFYYFAGDFSDNNIYNYSCYFRGIPLFRDFFIDRKDLTDRKYFFWYYYRPFLSKVLEEYEASL
jgi:hypothetical protein